MASARSTKWQRPPCRSISSILARLVERGTTAMNGRPSSWAKYASDTAVDPEDASITGVPLVTQPLQIA